MIDFSNETKSNEKQLLKIVFKGKSIQEQSESFFSTIDGFKGFKENFYRTLITKEQINTLLVGTNTNLKNSFLSHIKEQCHDVFYFDASNTHGSKLIEELYNNRLAQVIIIDNIDKLRKNYLDSLHNYLDNGRINQNYKEKKKDLQMKNIKIFATAQDMKKFSYALRSRFLDYHFP